jgi:hypothetical protein
MTVVHRPSIPSLSLWLLLSLLSQVFAAPHPSSSLNLVSHILARKTDPIISHSLNGSIIVVDPSTQQAIPQGPGTDGGGSNFSLPAVIWIILLLALGAPLAVAGIRGWRATTGVAIGLGTMVCSWAAIINSVDQVGISDIILTLVVLAFGFLGLIIGIFEFARSASMVLMCIIGGLAFGVRIILLKKDLILSSLVLDWIIIVIFGVGLGALLVWRQRAAMVIACASTGTFLTSLGIDLIFNKQSGLSLGLRSLFDTNDNHVAYFLQNTYNPTLSTKIILFASLGFTPFLALVQHLIFKEPFTRKPPPPSDEELCLNYPTEDLSGGQRLTALLSGLWDGAKAKGSRFSL